MILVYLERWSYERFQDDNNFFFKMKNDLTTGTWQDNIWCPIIIISFCTSDEPLVWVQTDCRVHKYWQTDKQTVEYVSTDRLILDLTHQGRFDKIWNHQPNDDTYWIPTFDQKLNARWTKDPMRCQSIEILKVYRFLMYKILSVGTHAIHVVVF